jgi:hypothetical protein
MDSSLDNIMSACGNGQSTIDLLISDCALVRLTDKAFETKVRQERWDQNHLGLVGYSSHIHVLLFYVPRP